MSVSRAATNAERRRKNRRPACFFGMRWRRMAFGPTLSYGSSGDGTSNMLLSPVGGLMSNMVAGVASCLMVLLVVGGGIDGAGLVNASSSILLVVGRGVHETRRSDFFSLNIFWKWRWR